MSASDSVAKVRVLNNPQMNLKNMCEAHWHSHRMNMKRIRFSEMQLPHIQLITNPPSAVFGTKLYGRAKILPQQDTFGKILWAKNGQTLIMNLRLRATAMLSK